MKLRYLIAAFLAAVCVTACAPSVHPFYSPADVVFEPRLLGTWIEKGKSDEGLWRFEKGPDKAYKLTFVEKEEKRGEFTATLFKLKDGLYLDLIAAKCDFASSQADLVAFSVFPGHLLVRLPELGKELKMAFFDFEWLDKHLDKNPSALAHHREDKRLLLTAGTTELQRFVLQHLGAKELFEDPTEYTRLEEPVVLPGDDKN